MPDALFPLLPSFLPPFPFKPAKLGIPARFDQMHLNAVAALHMLWQRRGNKTGILFPSEGELPLTRASHLPCRRKSRHKDLQLSEWGISAECQTSKNICIHHFKSEHETMGYH